MAPMASSALGIAPQAAPLHSSLGKLPVELLLLIFSKFSIHEFLKLTQISAKFRTILRDNDNAAQLCNLAIMNDPNFRKRWFELNGMTMSGWKVPLSFPVRVDRECSERITRRKVFKRLGYPIQRIPGLPTQVTDEIVMAWSNTGLKIRLNGPGPQFLAFLEYVSDEQNGCPKKRVKPNGTDIWNRRFYGSLAGIWIMRFFSRQEEKSLAITGCSDARRNNWFPKELLWYYDIDEIERDIEATANAINPVDPTIDSLPEKGPFNPINLSPNKRKRGDDGSLKETSTRVSKSQGDKRSGRPSPRSAFRTKPAGYAR